jgi:hypothetical protein
MRATGRARAPRPGGTAGLVAFAVFASGCVASIQEDRLYGAPRPRDEAAPDVVAERKPGEEVLDAAVHGSVLDVSVSAITECRDVDVTSRVRDVAIRRTFASSAQETNGALAILAATSVGLLQYSAEQIDCPQGSGCWSAMISSEMVMLALAAVPVGFLVYNAFHVRDGQTVEQAAPEVRAGAWRACSREPMAGEPVVIALRGAEWTRITDRTGHASVELTLLLPPTSAPAEREAPRALIRHAGSSDRVVDLTAFSAPNTLAPPQVGP